MNFQRALQDGHGNDVVVDVVIDESEMLEREIVRLAMKARESKHGVATSAGGVVQVRITKPAATVRTDAAEIETTAMIIDLFEALKNAMKDGAK